MLENRLVMKAFELKKLSTVRFVMKALLLKRFVINAFDTKRFWTVRLVMKLFVMKLFTNRLVANRFDT